ncbi:hypothetical protein Tco_1228378 [Tanacetum coccineum]
MAMRCGIIEVIIVTTKKEKDLRMCQSYRIPKFFQKICLELPAARQVNVNRLMSLAAALLARLGTFTLDTAKDLRQLKDWGHKTHRDSSILRQKCIPVVESKSCVGADFDVQEGMRTSLVYCDASHNRLGRGFDAKRECHSLRIPPTQEELNMRQSVGLKLLSDYDVRSDIHPGKAKRGLTFLKQILSAQSEAERKRTYQEDLRGMINKLETSRGRNAMLNIEVGFRVLGDFEALIMHESHKSHLHQEDDGRSERTFDVRDMLRACVLDLEKVGLTLTIGRSFRITTVTLPAIKAASLRALKPVEIIKPCGQASGEESYSIVMVRGNSKERLRPCFEEQSFFKGEECDNPEDSSVCLAWMLLIDLCEVYLPVPVMAISVISISSNSSEDSVGTPVGRVILFGTIPTTIPDTTPVITPPATQTDTPVIPTETPIIAPTIPPSPDYTPASPDYSPASDSESDPSEDPSSDHIPPLPAISPFLSSDDDTTDSDTPDTPPSPTHGTPFIEITASTQRSPIIPRRRVMILSPGQPIPHGRPYRYHPNGPIHMMTARKRVGLLPTHRLAVRHSANHSSSDSSSDFYSDASSDSSSRHSLSDHSSSELSTSAGPSRKRHRSPMTSVPALPLVSRALFPIHADLIPSPKRIRDSGYLADVEVDPSEVRLGIDVEDESFEQSRSRGTDLEVDDDVERSEGVDRDEQRRVRGPVLRSEFERLTHPAMPEDNPEPAYQEGALEAVQKWIIQDGDLNCGIVTGVKRNDLTSYTSKGFQKYDFVVYENGPWMKKDQSESLLEFRGTNDIQGNVTAANHQTPR